MKRAISMGYTAKFKSSCHYIVIPVVLPPKKYPVSSNVWKNMHFRNTDMKYLLFFFSISSILDR